MAAMLSCDPDYSNIFSFLKALKAVNEIWLQWAQWFQRRSRLKLWTDDGRTNGRTTEPAYTISTPPPAPFGSGELKTYIRLFERFTI